MVGARPRPRQEPTCNSERALTVFVGTAPGGGISAPSGGHDSIDHGDAGAGIPLSMGPEGVLSFRWPRRACDVGGAVCPFAHD